ncbi:MAG: mechanosensitive ion channel family protein [Firmicutes bacterium]|nr:mechanosensitive ion channel family protein [Bacillota bacterium]
MSWEQLSDWAVAAGSRLLGAAIILVVGLQIVKYSIRFAQRWFDKHNVDSSLRTFGMSAIKAVGYTILGVIVASTLGVEMTSVLALLGSAGLAIGLALQGSLSNLAGGVLILVFKPFKVGQFIEVGEHRGTVEAIQLFYTHLNTPDNQRVVVPNSDLANSNIINYSANSSRRVNLIFSVSHSADLDHVRRVLQRVIADQGDLVLPEPEPQVVVWDHSPRSIDFSLRCWATTDNYWPLRFALYEQVKKAFDREGIEIPFQQIDVHLKNAEALKIREKED